MSDVNQLTKQNFFSLLRRVVFPDALFLDYSSTIWLGNCNTNLMDQYELKIEAPWEEVKKMLQEINMELTDEDLHYEQGKEKELLERVSRKLNKSIPEVKGWIESVSHNQGLAY